MIKLGVNIDHAATLRQARYRETPRSSGVVIEPDIVRIACAAEAAGADSITAHLREDRRHMDDDDIFALRDNVRTKLNMEMACADSVLEVALRARPDYACLVPENRMEVTTEGGLDLCAHRMRVADAVAALSEIGVVCSLFIDPDFEQISLAKEIGAPVVELHTGSFANAWGDREKYAAELERIRGAAEFGEGIGLTVNAGHGINYENVRDIVSVPGLHELNIGHSIICRALFAGMEAAVREMRALLA